MTLDEAFHKIGKRGETIPAPSAGRPESENKGFAGAPSASATAGKEAGMPRPATTIKDIPDESDPSPAPAGRGFAAEGDPSEDCAAADEFAERLIRPDRPIPHAAANISTTIITPGEAAVLGGAPARKASPAASTSRRLATKVRNILERAAESFPPSISPPAPIEPENEGAFQSSPQCETPAAAPPPPDDGLADLPADLFDLLGMGGAPALIPSPAPPDLPAPPFTASDMPAGKRADTEELASGIAPAESGETAGSASSVVRRFLEGVPEAKPAAGGEALIPLPEDWIDRLLSFDDEPAAGGDDVSPSASAPDPDCRQEAAPAGAAERPFRAFDTQEINALLNYDDPAPTKAEADDLSETGQWPRKTAASGLPPPMAPPPAKTEPDDPASVSAPSDSASSSPDISVSPFDVRGSAQDDVPDMPPAIRISESDLFDSVREAGMAADEELFRPPGEAAAETKNKIADTVAADAADSSFAIPAPDALLQAISRGAGGARDGLRLSEFGDDAAWQGAATDYGEKSDEAASAAEPLSMESRPDAAPPPSSSAAIRPGAVRFGRVRQFDRFGYCPLSTTGRLSDAFRRLRGRALASARKPSLMLAGVSRGSGRTETAIHLALHLARRPGSRVCLADFDFRRPAVAARLGIPVRAFGVADLLRVACPLEDALVQSREDNLFVLPARPPDGDGDDLLDRDNAAALLERLHKAFEFVVVDCGVVGVDAGPALLAATAGGVTLTARAGRDRPAAVRRAARLLTDSGGAVVGLTLVGAA